MAEISYKNFTPAYPANRESQTSVPRRGGDIFDLADVFLSISAMTHKWKEFQKQKNVQRYYYGAKGWRISSIGRHYQVFF